MFTGIIEEIGRVLYIRSDGNAGTIRIGAQRVLEGTRVGDSIDVNGVCLTVTALGSGYFEADMMPTTLATSGLGSLKYGDPVDLERAVQSGGRLGGHIVSGHIDGTGHIMELRDVGNATVIRIFANPDILKLLVERGSVAVDGVSLTVASLDAHSFSVSITPHTGAETVLTSKRIGDVVNLETDIIGKYVERLMMNRHASSVVDDTVSSGITVDFLANCGF